MYQKDVISFLPCSALLIIKMDMKKINIIKKMVKVLPNEDDFSLVQEKVREFFKSLYSVKGLWYLGTGHCRFIKNLGPLDSS